ncbi:MAG: NUDIX domain-containing protein [Spongiibacteraceae bacterium]
MSTEIKTEVEVRPAATVALLRERPEGMEILLLRRQSKLAFAAGMWVFPGGRIDPEDYDDVSGDIFAAARRAAVREAMEEAAVAVDPDALVYFAHWTTPAHEGSLRRFATWFFVAGLDGEHAVQVDGGEIDDHQWLRPADAIASHRRREMALMPPTYAALKEMAACNTIEDVLTLYRTRKVIEIQPRHFTEPTFIAVYPGDVAYEGGDPQAPGPRHRSWINESGLQYERDPHI